MHETTSFSRSHLSPEFRLAAATLVWPRSSEFTRHIQDAASISIDWDLFVRIAHRHRIDGLTFQALDAASIVLPEIARVALKSAAERQAHKSLIFAGETIRVTRALQEAGIPVACLKGATLSMQAFGDLGIRHCRDIDLLIVSEHALKADEILASLGYQLEMPIGPHSLKQKQHWIQHRKHFEYKSGNGIPLELHWQLFDNRSLLPAEFASHSWVDVPVFGASSLQTLSLPDLLLYLCVHGANHMWFRLKWLADMQALLQQNGADAVKRLQADAIAHDCERPVAQTLILLQILFGANYPVRPVDAGTSTLVHDALNAMTSGDGAAELETVPFGTSRIAMARYRLKRDWKFWLYEANSLLTDERDRNNIRLPHSMRFLLPLLRLPLWIGRRIRSRGQYDR